MTFCVVVFVASFFVASTKDSTAAYSLSVVSFVIFFALYSVGVLGYKIGGNYIQLETKVGNLEKESTELKELVTALLKSIYVLEHGASVWTGNTKEHHALVDEYLSPISHLFSGDIRSQVLSDIKKFNAPNT